MSICQVSCCDSLSSVLALGTQQGQLLIYQLGSLEASCVSLVISHTKAVLSVAVSRTRIVSCSEDCSVTVVRLLSSGALLISHILQVSHLNYKIGLNPAIAWTE